MIGLFSKKKSAIALMPVDLGEITIKIPVAELQGASEGPTLLITAGNDGDEYAGMKACYSLIEDFSKEKFSGTLIVIPIVNIPGFTSQKSQNPLDGLYPKHIYPGKIDGFSTERLRFWLSGYVKRADVWMDLHGGSLTEIVHPYVHAWKSNIEPVDSLARAILEAMSIETVVFQDSPDRVRKPKKGDCVYLMCESGFHGGSSEEEVSRHKNWTRSVMGALQMIHKKVSKNPKVIYTDVHEYTLSQDGVWFSQFPNDQSVKKGETLGTLRSHEGGEIEIVRVKQTGVLLWGKDGMSGHKGDVIAGVGVL